MRVRMVALVPVLGVSLLACGAEEAPRPAPLPSAASASPTAPAAALPSEASAPTPAGAAATARYFYEELGRALVSQDTAALRAVSSPTCTPCKNFADAIDRDREAGKRFTGGEVTAEVAAATRSGTDRAAVVLLYSAAPLQRVDMPASADPAIEDLRLTVQLVRSGEAWLVDSITRAAS